LSSWLCTGGVMDRDSYIRSLLLTAGNDSHGSSSIDKLVQVVGYQQDEIRDLRRKLELLTLIGKQNGK